MAGRRGMRPGDVNEHEDGVGGAIPSNPRRGHLDFSCERRARVGEIL